MENQLIYFFLLFQKSRGGKQNHSTVKEKKLLILFFQMYARNNFKQPEELRKSQRLPLLPVNTFLYLKRWLSRAGINLENGL